MAKVMAMEKELKLERDSCWSSATSSIGIGRQGAKTIVELLDDYWSFHNCLSDEQSLIAFSPLSCNKGKKNVTANTPTKIPPNNRSDLLRAPSLPSDTGKRTGTEDQAMATKPGKAHLLLSYSSVEKVPPASSRGMSGAPRERPPRNRNVGHGNHHHHHQMDREDNYRRRRLLQLRKWKSLSDLEQEEVQGFKDLGFVFDDKAVVSPDLLNVIPGLRGKGGEEKVVDGDTRRPYLSEAWLVQRRPSPPVIEWNDRRSPADAKEKLRFWARAVASNVRQECCR